MGGFDPAQVSAALAVGGLLFFPGILFMSLIFMSQGISADVWIESERGTLRRIVTAPRPLAAFVAGKVPDSLTDDRYFNIKRMQRFRLR